MHLNCTLQVARKSICHTLYCVQDAQFTIGKSSKFSAALWYPIDGNPWHGSGHYTVSCDWVAMDVAPAGYYKEAVSGRSWDAAAAFGFVVSLVALVVSIFVGYLVVSKTKAISFSQIYHDPL